MNRERTAGGAVRRANRADVPELAQLFRQEAEHEAGLSQGAFTAPADFNWQAFAEQALARPRSAVFVYTGQQSISGLIYVRVVHESQSRSRSLLARVIRKASGHARRSSMNGPEYAMIEQFYVRPESRNSFIALRLFKTAERWTTEQGIDDLRGVIWHENEYVSRFAQTLGMKPLRTIFRKTLGTDRRREQ